MNRLQRKIISQLQQEQNQRTTPKAFIIGLTDLTDENRFNTYKALQQVVLNTPVERDTNTGKFKVISPDTLSLAIENILNNL